MKKHAINMLATTLVKTNEIRMLKIREISA